MVMRTFKICKTSSGKQKKKNKDGSCPSGTTGKTVKRNVGKRRK